MGHRRWGGRGVAGVAGAARRSRLLHWVQQPRSPEVRGGAGEQPRRRRRGKTAEEVRGASDPAAAVGPFAGGRRRRRPSPETKNEDGCICLFDLRCKDVACTIDVAKEPVSSLCFKGGNEDVIYASSGTKISCFDIHMIVFSPKSYFLAAADDSGDVKIIDTRQQSLYKTLRAVHSSICSSVQFLSWKPWTAITGGLDSKLAIWDYSKGRAQNIIDYGMPELDSKGTTSNAGQCYNPSFVHSVAVPEVGTLAGLNKVCAVARGDCVVEVMELESESATTKSRSSSQPKKASSSRGSDVRAANDSTVDPSLRKRLQLDHSLGGHTAAVSCVSFSLFGERGKFLISGGNDSFVKMWSWSRHFIDAQSSCSDDLLLNLNVKNKVNWLCTTPSDSENLVVCSTSKVMKVYTIP